MRIAFVLHDKADSTASRRELITSIHESGGQLETWTVGPWDIRCVEDCLRRLEAIYTAKRMEILLFDASPSGHELGVRLAARLNCGCFPETIALLQEGNTIFARKKVCGSNLNWDTEITGYPAILTVAEKKAARSVPLQRRETRPLEPLSLPQWILEYEQSEVFPANPLESAPLIFVAGRGVGTKSACDRLRCIAEHFGAPLGFSRPAALNGWGQIAQIIGQSGVHTGAKVCIMVGVSGAAAFMAGIDPKSTLIAVNPDKNAPIFRYADIGIVACAQEFIDALEMEIKNNGNKE